MDLKTVIDIELQRYLFHSGSTESNCFENYSLHIFSDASQTADDACVYLVAGNQSVLIMTRNRVA